MGSYRTHPPLDEAVRRQPRFSIAIPYYYTKAFRENPGKPNIIRMAEGLRLVLENLPIVIRPDELIVGTFDEDIPIAVPRPEATGLNIMGELRNLGERHVNPIRVSEDDIRVFEEEIYPYWREYNFNTYAREVVPEEYVDVALWAELYIPTEVGGIAHAILDYPALLSRGLKYYLEKAREKIKILGEEADKDPDALRKIPFYKAVVIIAEALIKYAHRYAEAARELAEEEGDPLRRRELLKIADVCMHVPENPPRDLHEAIQFIWFIHMAVHIENFEHGISFGRIDQYLYKYYDGDREYALRLFKNLFLKVNEIVALYDSLATMYFGGMSTTQGLNVGGVDRSGGDATNELSYIVIEAIKENNMPNPNLIVRFSRDSPERLYNAVRDVLAAGVNAVAVVYDDIGIKALMGDGASLEEARDYGIVGCVGLSTGGVGFNNTAAIFFNLAKPLETLFRDDLPSSKYVDRPSLSSIKSMDEFIAYYRESLKSLLSIAVKAANAYQYANMVLKPTPLMSICIRGCFEKGLDVTEGGAKYNFRGVHIAGFADVVDSLAAIEKAVFIDGVVSLEELGRALKKDFRGYEKLLNYLLYKCPKYGNDDDQVDKYARLLVDMLYEIVSGMRNFYGEKYRLGIHAMTTHVGFGLFTGALPSGRKSGKPLANDIGPRMGGEKGVTASIRSVTKIDLTKVSNGFAYTLTLNPRIVGAEEGRIFIGLLRGYHRLGGFHMQFNALSADILRDAQRNPGKYRDLLVRISGYSARFIDLPREIQDEIICRYEYKG
jgi:formate C-acetyltransferase